MITNRRLPVAASGGPLTYKPPKGEKKKKIVVLDICLVPEKKLANRYIETI